MLLDEEVFCWMILFALLLPKKTKGLQVGQTLKLHCFHLLESDYYVVVEYLA